MSSPATEFKWNAKSKCWKIVSDWGTTTFNQLKLPSEEENRYVIYRRGIWRGIIDIVDEADIDVLLETEYARRKRIKAVSQRNRIAALKRWAVYKDRRELELL